MILFPYSLYNPILAQFLFYQNIILVQYVPSIVPFSQA